MILQLVDKNAPSYSYCRNTCFRSVRYLFEGPTQESLILKVCKKDSPTLCNSFQGGRRGDSGPHSYIAHLPVGSAYDAILLDNTGREVASGTLVESYEPSSCEGLFNISYIGALQLASTGSSSAMFDSNDSSSYLPFSLDTNDDDYV